MSERQYRTRSVSVMAERFFVAQTPWPEGVKLKAWPSTGKELPTIWTNQHGDFPIADGDWIVRYASGRVEVFGNVTFNENFEEQPT